MKHLSMQSVWGLVLVLAWPAGAATFFFSTGNPDGLMGTLSRPSGIETETADDFVLTQTTIINQATFVGLLPAGAALSSILDVEIEIYRVFPVDSANPPSGSVPTRINSPSDTQLIAFDSVAGTLSVVPTLLNSSFAVANTVVNGINKIPNQFTGGEGPATGEEVLFTITFTPNFTLPAGHYFFRPEVALSSGNFLWLSAPKPIVSPGTPFAPDLQSWIRNANLAPDWLRIGTDITGQGPFNAAFSLSGSSVPDDAYQIVDPSNLLIGDSEVNMTNAGTRNGFDPAGGICANVYVFDPSEELIACCACYVSPDGLRSLSAKQDLVSNTLTPGVPGSIVIKLLASTPAGTICNPSSPTPATLEPGLRAWGTDLHQNTTSGAYRVTENAFQNAVLSDSELTKLTTYCGFIQANGSTFGICKACRFGGLGGAQQ